MIYRDIQFDDLKTISELLSEELSVFNPILNKCVEAFDQYSKDSNYKRIVAVNEAGKVVGYASLIIELNVRSGKIGHIEDVAVNSIYSNQGIGKKLIEKFGWLFFFDVQLLRAVMSQN